MAKKAYVAVNRIMVKAKPPTYIEPKTPFLMDEKEGERLVGLGAAARDGSAEIVTEPAAQPVDDPVKTEAPVDRIAAIKGVMRGLGPEDMTTAGTPDVTKVNAALPEGVEPISAKERNAIWADIQEEDDLV